MDKHDRKKLGTLWDRLLLWKLGKYWPILKYSQYFLAEWKFAFVGKSGISVDCISNTQRWLIKSNDLLNVSWNSYWFMTFRAFCMCTNENGILICGRRIANGASNVSQIKYFPICKMRQNVYPVNSYSNNSQKIHRKPPDDFVPLIWKTQDWTYNYYLWRIPFIEDSLLLLGQVGWDFLIKDDSTSIGFSTRECYGVQK